MILKNSRLFMVLKWVLIGMLPALAGAQGVDLKEQALDAFKKENYPEAIELLERAVTETPDDAEIYYYLGFFNHYLANDSRPLQGYDFNFSEKIFSYLRKALEINPDYGDAKYFYSVECGSNAFKAMQNYDLEKLKYFYQEAYEIGGFPSWLLEFGRNLLGSCEKDAILFTGGDVDFNVCTYLQLHEGFRRDVTIIPIGYIDRPWYILFLKRGLEGGVRPIRIELSDEEIMDMHPYKWKSATISIPVPDHLQTRYSMECEDMQWLLEPDFESNRMHRKLADEAVTKRTYLSPHHAILLHIIEANRWERPICFPLRDTGYFTAGLHEYFQDHALYSRLLPFKTDSTDFKRNIPEIEKTLFETAAFEDYRTILTTNIPRVSGILLRYWSTCYYLALYYYNRGLDENLGRVIDLVEKKFRIGFNDKVNEPYFNAIKEMRKRLRGRAETPVLPEKGI